MPKLKPNDPELSGVFAETGNEEPEYPNAFVPDDTGYMPPEGRVSTEDIVHRNEKFEELSRFYDAAGYPDPAEEAPDAPWAKPEA